MNHNKQELIASYICFDIVQSKIVIDRYWIFFMLMWSETFVKRICLDFIKIYSLKIQHWSDKQKNSVVH